METTPIKPVIQRKPAGYLMYQANGKFSQPKPLFPSRTGILLKIGSDPSNQIIIKKAEVAPFHAELRQVTYQGQSKVIIQDCRPNTDYFPIMVGDQTVPTQSTMYIPEDMPKITIGKHTFIFLYTIPAILLAVYPQLAAQNNNTTTSATNSLNQSQSTDMLSQMLSSQSVQPLANSNGKKEETPNNLTQQYLQNKTVTFSSSSIKSESKPETQPNYVEPLPTHSTQKSSSTEINPENATKDVPQPYSLSFSQIRGEEPDASVVEEVKHSDKERPANETSESEPAPTPSKKKGAPKSAKKQTSKASKKKPQRKESKELSQEEAHSEEPQEEPNEEPTEQSNSEDLDDLVSDALTMLVSQSEESQSESSSTEIVKEVKATPKKSAKKPPKPKKSANKREDWTCGTCQRNVRGNMIPCKNCGTWHHCKCVGSLDPDTFWCETCQKNSECPVCHHNYWENPELMMVGCDGECGRWFHANCLGARVDLKKDEYVCKECRTEGRQKVKLSEQEEEEPVEEEVKQEAPSSPTETTKIVYDPKAARKGSQSAKASKTKKKVTHKGPNTVAISKTRKVTTPKKTPKKPIAANPVPPSDSEGQEPSSSSEESDSDEKENVYDTFKMRQQENQYVPKVSSKFAYFKSPPIDLAKTRLQQKTSPAPKKLF